MESKKKDLEKLKKTLSRRQHFMGLFAVKCYEGIKYSGRSVALVLKIDDSFYGSSRENPSLSMSNISCRCEIGPFLHSVLW